MKLIIYIFFAVSLLLITGCNNRQAVAKRQAASDTLVHEDTAENDRYSPNRQSINLFTLILPENENVAFVSLSDIYPLSEKSDSIAIPDIRIKGLEASRYFKLEGKYKERFYSETGITDTDSLFVYHYADNAYASFLARDLEVVAKINNYASDSDWPFSHYEYMIGFEINKEKLNGFRDKFYDALVFVGKENPFTKEPLTPIVWKKTDGDEYPVKKIEEEWLQHLNSAIKGNTYLFEKENLKYYLQDFLSDPSHNDPRPYGRRLIVVDSTTNDVIIDKIFARGEGSSPSPLNYTEEAYGEINQWTGKLLKDKPPVVFGFEYISFGCPYISVIDKSGEDIFLNCDNRH